MLLARKRPAVVAVMAWLAVPWLVVSSLIVPWLFTPVPARAQSTWPLPVDDPVLAALIDEALAKSPDVAGASAAAEAAESRPAQAGSLPNPMIGTEYTNDGWSPSLGSQDMTTLAFMAGQELPYPGKRALRADIASREAGQFAQLAERVRRSVAAAVKRAYFGLLLARETLDIIGDQEQIWIQIEGVARARYAVGQGAQQDVLRAQIEVTRIEQFRAEQEADAEVRLAELNRLLDRPAAVPVETGAQLSLRPTEVSLEQILEWVGEVSPEVAAAGLDSERASLALELAKREYKPDFSVQAGYMNRGSLDPMWQSTFGLSLPLYRKRIAAGVPEAEASLRSSRSAVESTRLELRLRTQERLARLAATERIAILYLHGIVPQDLMSVEAAISNYQTGQVPFIAVLEALTTLYDDRSTHLRLLAEHEQILASLEEASLEPTAAMAPAGAAGMGGAGGSKSMAGSGGGAQAMGGSGGMGNR